MKYNFKEDEIRRQVLDLMHQNSIAPYGDIDIQLDGKVHRFRTADDKPSEKSGGYFVDITEWPFGFVQDWRLNQQHIDFSFKRERLDEEGKKFFDDKKYNEAIQRSLQRQKDLREKQEAEKEKSRITAIDRYKQLPNASNDFPYLKKKEIILPEIDEIDYSGIKYDKKDNKICIPLKDINGDYRSFQWIDENGSKKFQFNTSPSGAFYNLDLSTLEYDLEKKTPILIGEGFATMLTVYNLLGRKYPIVAAMDCGNLFNVAQAIKEKYKGWNIFIMADNDHLRANGNIGLIKANEANEKLNLNGVIIPHFTRKETGTDWNDFCTIHGKDTAREKILKEITLCLMPEEKRKVMQQIRDINAQILLNKDFPPLKWAVKDFIPSGLTLLAGGPKVGKSILSLHISLAIAIGGSVFGKIDVEKGSVLYLALEDTEQRLQERIKQMGMGNENLSKLTLRTITPRQNLGGLNAIRWWLEEHEDARLVIVDTLEKFRKQADGKTSIYSQDYEVMAEMKSLADEFDVAFSVVHHLRKAAASDWIGELSGTQGIAGAADTIMSLKRDRNSFAGILNITGRDVEEKTYDVELDKFSWHLIGEHQEDFKNPIPKWKQQIFDYLIEHKTITPAELSNEYGITPSTAKSNLHRLTEEGEIKKIGYGQYAVSENYDYIQDKKGRSEFLY